MRILESIYKHGEGFTEPVGGWVYDVTREEDLGVDVLSLTRPWAPSRPIRFRSCAALVYGDYVGAGVLGRANIAAVSENIANVSKVSMRDDAFRPYYGFDPRNGAGGEEACDAYHRSEGILQCGDFDSHQLWIREDRWAELGLDWLLDYPVYDENAYSEAEAAAKDAAWNDYVAADILRDLLAQPEIDEMKGDALVALERAVGVSENSTSLEDVLMKIDGLDDKPKAVTRLITFVVRDEDAWPEWVDETDGMCCANIKEIAETAIKNLKEFWPLIADEERKRVAKESGQMSLLGD